MGLWFSKRHLGAGSVTLFFVTDARGGKKIIKKNDSKKAGVGFWGDF